VLSIARVGAPFNGKVQESVIYRLRKAPESPVKYPYLVVSDTVDEPADVLMIEDFRRLKEKLKKKVKKGTGLEVTIAQARKRDAVGVSRWLEDARDLYSFCRSSRCQLVISSGAEKMQEMVSGHCFDAILKSCGIDPQMHWREMENWLESKLSRRVAV
jgi:hypothetical protein